MTAKTILSLAQAHRREPSRKNYAALAEAVRKLEAERDAAVAALLEVCRVLRCNPAIVDTVWAGPGETLLDLCLYAISKSKEVTK